MERERPRPPALRDGPGAPEPERLAALLARARGTEGAGRRLIARKINAVLQSMRAPGNEAAEADAVLAGLEQKQFHELVDDAGVDCRTEAVQTLLACGFPHALKVSPEDLEYARIPSLPRETAREEPEHTRTPTRDALLPMDFSVPVAFFAVLQLAFAIAAKLGMGSVLAGVGALAFAVSSYLLLIAEKYEDRALPVALCVLGSAFVLATGAAARSWLLVAPTLVMAAWAAFKLLTGKR